MGLGPGWRRYGHGGGNKVMPRIKVAPKEDRTMDGVVFASLREMLRYSELKMLSKSGIISDLELQPKFPIVLNGVKICNYISDFRYLDQQGRTIVEDSKGMKTEIYRLKAKLFHACYPHLRIVEV
jgi:hypothetical protein